MSTLIVTNEGELRVKLTVPERSTLIKRLCGMWGLKYRIGKCGGDGQAKMAQGYILINKDLFDRDGIVSAVIHEACHFFALRDGKWPAYHSLCIAGRRPPNNKRLRAWKLTALKAERWIDQQAEKIALRMFPNIEYACAYRTKDDARWFRCHAYVWADNLILRNKQGYRDRAKKKRKVAR